MDQKGLSLSEIEAKLKAATDALVTLTKQHPPAHEVELKAANKLVEIWQTKLANYEGSSFRLLPCLFSVFFSMMS